MISIKQAFSSANERIKWQMTENYLREPEFPVASTLSERLRCESFCYFGSLDRRGAAFDSCGGPNFIDGFFVYLCLATGYQVNTRRVFSLTMKSMLSAPCHKHLSLSQPEHSHYRITHSPFLPTLPSPCFLPRSSASPRILLRPCSNLTHRHSLSQSRLIR